MVKKNNTVKTIVMGSMLLLGTISPLLGQTANASNFTPTSKSVVQDVSVSDPLYPAVYSLFNQNIITGFTTDHENYYFKPDQAVTRGEAAKMIANTLGIDYDLVPDMDFKDVSKTSWYYKPVVALNKMGAIQGFNDGKIHPNDTVTRAQMAKMLSVSLKFSTTSNTNLPFTDVSKGYWATPYIGALISKNVTNGTSSTTFSPGENVSRKQMAAFLYRGHNVVPASTFNKYEANNIYNDLQAKIQDTFFTGLISSPKKTFAEVRPSFLKLASPALTDGIIKENYPKACTGCDAQFMFVPMEPNLSFNFISKTDTKIVFESATPTGELSTGHRAQITLVKQNGHWILENYVRASFEDKPLNLTVEQATNYIKKNIEYLNSYDNKIQSVTYTGSTTESYQSPTTNKTITYTQYHYNVKTTTNKVLKAKFNSNDGGFYEDVNY